MKIKPLRSEGWLDSLFIAITASLWIALVIAACLTLALLS